MKIVVFEYEDWEKSEFDTLGANNQIDVDYDPLGIDNAARYQDAEIVTTFVNSDMGRDVLEQMPHLKFIATRSTGFDHIDMDYCKAHDITVSNVPSYGEETVAEHVFALLLSISHKMPQAISRTRQGNFSQDGLQGFDLQGKTLGIIGTGHIGLNVIKIANGFRMNVIAFDAYPDQSHAEELGFEYVSFESLLSQSDIISLHVPSNKNTKNLISHDEFDRMKDGVVIINTARGDVMDVKALLGALAHKKVSAAGLDVLPEEPTIKEEAELLRTLFTKNEDLETLLADHILLHLDNVIITPHSAFNTKEATERILKTTIENIDGFLNNNVINAV